ncbi:PREDICTED: lactosylceramide 4-alpha-galactosyltransferase-like [Camelina sativa]|uniref:Lactosylceramide 4-alpha-galactosyltransferase-like n=1 Tax=Camelina sativa TaxID=90675 RepID=A0ABM1RPV8_CAMSA|nr:PREDICTED: lactosylceramide 4-alpha-galactosyltransferase-like [Camelina sativa]
MQARKPLFAIYAIAVLVLYLLFIESPKSVVPDNNSPFKRNLPLSRTDDPVAMSTRIVKVVDSDHDGKKDLDPLLDPLVPPRKASKIERIDWFRRKLPDMEILKSTSKSKRFHSRVFELYNNNNCSAQFFMVWLSPAKSFGPREMLAVDTLFTTNPGACLAILSNSLDSCRGDTILKPLLDRGFNLIAVTFDIPFLVKNTPAEAWLKRLKSGRMDPGSIPLFMNLSDLTRLAVLYKYGGVYLDTDIIFLNDITRLRNAIGAQSIDPKTKTWSRLNNAVMVFDIYHPLMREFLHEYSTTFDGNIWGHNSPYLVSRVITRLGNKPGYNVTILPPNAFYPVNWIKIPKLFKKPATTREAQWVEKTLQDMSKGSYMIHLWNKVTRKIKIEEGSVMYNLISTHCTVCRNITNSHTV